LFARIIEAQKTDKLATELLEKLDRCNRDHVTHISHVTKHVIKHHVTDDVTKDETTTEEWAVDVGNLTIEGRVYVPDTDELRPNVITVHHNNSESKQSNL
jgi:hypothetical protein